MEAMEKIRKETQQHLSPLTFALSLFPCSPRQFSLSRSTSGLLPCLVLLQTKPIDHDLRLIEPVKTISINIPNLPTGNTQRPFPQSIVKRFAVFYHVIFWKKLWWYRSFCDRRESSSNVRQELVVFTAGRRKRDSNGDRLDASDIGSKKRLAKAVAVDIARFNNTYPFNGAVHADVCNWIKTCGMPCRRQPRRHLSALLGATKKGAETYWAGGPEPGRPVGSSWHFPGRWREAVCDFQGCTVRASIRVDIFSIWNILLSPKFVNDEACRGLS